MRTGFRETKEGNFEDSSDNDRHRSGNLDLLNLRVCFTSDEEKPRRKKNTSRGVERSDILGSGDESISRSIRRHRYYPRVEEFSELNFGAYSRGHGDTGLPSRNLLLPRSCYGRSASSKPLITNRRAPSQEKSVVLLYSNKLNNQVSSSAIKSEDFLYPRHKQYRELHKPDSQIIDVYSIDTGNMAKRPTSKNQLSEAHIDATGEGGTFPFKVTPSGNFKVNSQQVVFESEKLSVLVADPKHTKVNIRPDNFHEPTISRKMKNNDYFHNNSAMETLMSEAGISSIGSLIAGNTPIRDNTKEAPEYESKETNEILDPELNLGRLGYTAGEEIAWEKVTLPEKKNLYLELYARITNYTNADCKVYIDNEEFNCHLIVLQCYSELFDAHVSVKKVELPPDKCSPSSFTFIYDWMITGEPSYRELTRENVLDIFNAAKYLKIKDLVEQCWAFIDNTDVFNEDTAFLLYMDAKDKSLSEVRELMLPRIQKFFLMLVSSQDWLELDIDDVMSLLKSNYVCVNCEMEIFMSAVRWLKHDWNTRSPHKIDVLTCVRFGNIAPWQLIDIKRNPDNIEFMELAKNPETCKMIDDGLAYVIIKYWYGQENDDFQHWNNVLGLQEPPPRNWSGSDKTYFTYREFLIYLDQYRRNQMIEKTKPKSTYDRKLSSTESKLMPGISSDKIITTKMPTMDSFLAKKKAPSMVYSASHAPEIVNKVPVQKKMSKNKAATVIQAAFRGYLARMMVSEFAPETYKKLRARKLQTTQALKVTHPAKRSESSSDQKLLDMFSLSNNLRARTHMCEMSVSALGPPHKEYITETSLFLPDRESVVVFGGVDPHNTYGVGRNTGKDICRFLPDYNIWEYVGDLPEPRHHHSVGFLKGRVYLVGGADPRDDDVRGKSIVVDTVWSFEPVKRSWFSEGSLNTPRKNFGLVVTNQSLFAIGGQDRMGRTLGSVEQFNPLTGSWEDRASLLYPRMGVACAKYREYIWAAGGLSGSKKNPLSDVVESYDLRTDQWTEITRLRFPRCFSCMFVMTDRLYLIGGAGRVTEKEKTTTSVGTIDIWDVNTVQWKHMTEMAIPRHGHSVAYLGTQILIIGGVTTIYMRALSNAECFCGQRGTWVRGIACLPNPLSGHASVTLPPAVLMTS